MEKDYTHISKGKELRSVAGFYVVEEEKRIPLNGKEVLVIIGYAVVNTSCCGVGGVRFALVPGYVKKWQYKTDEKGTPVTQVEILPDEIKENLNKTLPSKEIVQQVIFW